MGIMRGRFGVHEHRELLGGRAAEIRMRGQDVYLGLEWIHGDLEPRSHSCELLATAFGIIYADRHRQCDRISQQPSNHDEIVETLTQMRYQTLFMAGEVLVHDLQSQGLTFLDHVDQDPAWLNSQRPWEITVRPVAVVNAAVPEIGVTKVGMKYLP